jgi:hypothetical protein
MPTSDGIWAGLIAGQARSHAARVIRRLAWERACPAMRSVRSERLAANHHAKGMTRPRLEHYYIIPDIRRLDA